jgi:hypothetical protein
MTRERRRASERARLLALTFAAACAAAACRQTVILDPAAQLDAGGGAAGAAGFDGGKPETGGGAGTGGAFDGGFPFDARLDALTFCFGGQVQRLQFRPHSPDVIFVVDRSSAMQAWFGEGSTLQVMQQQVEKLVTKYERSIHFGYVEFPGPSAMCPSGPGCCGGMVIGPLSRSVSNIQSSMHACDNNGPGCALNQRPLADALARSNRAFSMTFNLATTANRYVVVLTGAEPTCGGAAAGDGGSTPCESAVSEVAKLNLQSIFTAVVGVGVDATSNACLAKLAAAGTYSNDKPYLAQTPNALSDALAPIVQGMAEESCHLDVTTPPLDPKNVSLFINNVEIDPDPVDGWEFDPGTTLKITVRGQACDMLVRDPRTVELISGCPPSHRN